MSVKRLQTSVHPTEGTWPEVEGATNYATASGFTLRRISDLLAQVLAKRQKCHFSMWTDQSNVNNPDIPARFLIRTSLDLISYGVTHLLRAHIVLTAGRYDATSKPDPSVIINVIDVTGARAGATNSSELRNTQRDSNIGPLNYRAAELEIPLDVDPLVRGRERTFELQVQVKDLCQIISLCVYEVPRRALSSADDDIWLNDELTEWHVGGRVYSSHVAELFDLLRRAWDEQGSVFFAWSPMDSSKAAQVTAAVLTNLWDSNTGWDAGAYGFLCSPERQGSLDDDSVGVVFWAVVDPGQSGTDWQMGALQLVDQGGEVGYFDVQNYPPELGDEIVTIAYQTRWPSAATLADVKLDVLGNYFGATQLTVLGCGAYAKEPLDPRSVSGLAVWLAADKIMGHADADPVATWPDASGNGNDAAQATGSKQPLFYTGGIARRPIVRFDGADDFMAIADSATYKAEHVTVFVVARRTADAADSILVCYPHDVTHTTPYFRWALDLQTSPAVSLIVAGDVAAAGPADSITNTLMRLWSYDSRYRTLERDGSLIYTDDVSPTTITYPNAVGLYIGADVAGGEVFQGDVAEILVYTRQLRDDERARVGEYLSEKYGLQRGPK